MSHKASIHTATEHWHACELLSASAGVLHCCRSCCQPLVTSRLAYQVHISWSNAAPSAASALLDPTTANCQQVPVQHGVVVNRVGSGLQLYRPPASPRRVLHQTALQISNR